MTKTNEKKTITTKANEITKAIKAIKIEKANETIKAKTKTKKEKKNVNLRIRILIIIFTMKKPFAKRASTRKRVFEIIKNFINILFIKRLCDIYMCEKTFFNLLKCEQCDINHVVI